MVEQVRISGPVEMDSRSRVALDLAVRIASEESATRSNEVSGRRYWLELYYQCYRVAGGNKPPGNESSD